jgi:nicotinate-nucleotide adenylyltransferase
VRVGVFGGSFDPVHHAHLIVAGLAREHLGLDHVRFVVAGEQPFKGGRHHATAVQRARMVELALGDADGLVLDRRELRRPGPSYTIDTLRELSAEIPATEWVVLLGADSAQSFATWHQPEAIRQLATIAVFQRGIDAPPAGFDVTVPVPALELSSSAVRRRAARGLSLLGWVPPRVAEYIAAERIYRDGAG